MKLSQVCHIASHYYHEDMGSLYYLDDILNCKLNFEHKAGNGSALKRIVISEHEAEDPYSSVIIDVSTWSIISVMPRRSVVWRSVDLAGQTEDAYQKRHLADSYISNGATITKIIDGTCVNVYFFDGRWHIATKNAYDLSRKKWIGPLTSAEVFYKVSPDDFRNEVGLSLTENKRLSFAALDKQYSYNFIIRESRYNPFNPHQEGIYFNNMTQVQDDNSITEIYENPFYSIPSLERVYFAGVEELIESLEGSMRRREGFGYIIRPDAGDQIMIQSRLFQQIQFHAYRFLNKGLNNNNRENYRILRNVLSRQNYSEFLYLFPQYSAKHAYYIQVIEDLKTAINQNDPLPPGLATLTRHLDAYKASKYKRDLIINSLYSFDYIQFYLALNA